MQIFFFTHKHQTTSTMSVLDENLVLLASLLASTFPYSFASWSLFVLFPLLILAKRLTTEGEKITLFHV